MKRVFSSELALGILGGTLAYLGIRGIAAFIEGIVYGGGYLIPLQSAGATILLFPIGVGLIFRSRVSFIIAKVYLWIFAIGNTILIPLYLTKFVPSSMKNAATITTWAFAIFLLLLIYRLSNLQSYFRNRRQAEQSVDLNT